TSQAGLEVPILIGVDGQETSNLVAAGKPVPAPVLARGLLDTGSSISAVAPWVLQRLGVASKGQAATQTAGGQIPVQLFHVSISILAQSKPAGPSFTLPSVWVSELAVVLPDADVLIGLNVLFECKLLLDGPARVFALAF
ncbi:MAG: retroviral-like aspartic protease family protein, partial [Gemmataceae bacterium]|nr:retroviral-like aspartic protease family protein [Gemmataceae bacterium]